MNREYLCEYLCEHCDGSFSSYQVRENHRKKSCIGIKHEIDQKQKMDEIFYEESRKPLEFQKKCTGCNISLLSLDFYECNCLEEEYITNLIKDKQICCRYHFIKKFH